MTSVDFLPISNSCPFEEYASVDLQRTLDSALGKMHSLKWWVCLRKFGPSLEDGAGLFWLWNANGASAADGSAIKAEIEASLLHALRAQQYGGQDGDVDRALLSLQAAGPAVYPIYYQSRLAGFFSMEPAEPIQSLDAAARNELMSEMSLIAHRQLCSDFIQKHYERRLMLLGSHPLLKLQDVFIERAALTLLPVLIVGEPGCEKEYIAYALHAAGPLRQRPFLMLDCSSLASGEISSALVDPCSCGTIFLHNIDALPAQSQTSMLQVLANTKSGAQFRWIASTSKDPSSEHNQQHFYGPLVHRLDFLRTTLPPLRLRKNDVACLSAFWAKRYSLNRQCDIDEDVLEILVDYHWPHNVEQLERTIARLAVLSGSTIRKQDVARHAPEISAAEGSAFISSGSRKPQDEALILVRSGVLHIRGGISHSLERHNVMKKAVDYIMEHYGDHVRLQAVAKASCVSVSHLCFLLRKILGVNFRTLLLYIRLEKAKELLIRRPDLRITEISQQVGFCELSQFDRSFKKIVGCTPMQYRRISQSDTAA